MAAPPVLTTPRVRLRPFRSDDADALFALFSDPGVARYWSHPAWTSRDEAVAQLAHTAEAQATQDVCFWAMSDPVTDVLVGQVSLFHLHRVHLRAEVGYALGPALQGKGLAHEAVRAALTHAFNAWGFTRIEADVDPRNVPSRRLLEALGFRQEGVLRARWHVAGEVCDSLFFGLLRDELR